MVNCSDKLILEALPVSISCWNEIFRNVASAASVNLSCFGPNATNSQDYYFRQKRTHLESD